MQLFAGRHFLSIGVVGPSETFGAPIGQNPRAPSPVPKKPTFLTLGGLLLPGEEA